MLQPRPQVFAVTAHMSALRHLTLFLWTATAPWSCRNAFSQTDYFIVPVQPTKAALTSVQWLPDGSFVYSDAYGVYHVRGSQTDTLLTNPVQEPYCYARMFGWYCVVWMPAVYHPKPMTAGADGAIYIADPEKHLIQRYDPATRAFVTVVENAGSPTSLAPDHLGRLYFNDPEGCRVRRLDQGSVTTVAGTGTCGYTNDGGPATTAQILSVRAIAVDASDQIYIADNKAGVVRRVDRNGIITTVAGVGTPGQGGEATPVERTPLNGPTALVVDGQGNLFIADGNRIRMAGTNGLIRTIAGNGGAGHTGDYSLATAAQLTSPACLALTGTGALEICDADRVRKLVPIPPERWILPVLNTADALPRFSAGSWVTVLGDFPRVPTQDWSSSIGSDGSLPTSLAGVTAEVSGHAAAIAYVSPDRIDLLLPDALDATYPGPQTLQLTTPGATRTFRLAIVPSAPEFLMRAAGGKLYPAATTANLSWITPFQPARPGETITLYITGVNLDGPTAPPYDITQTNGMQVVLRSFGYPVTSARPFSPGVVELKVTLPSDLPPGELPIRLVHHGAISTQPTLLPVSTRN